jgi:hypothetical protein
MNPTVRTFAFLLLISAATFVSAADYPAPVEGDYTIRDFKFTSGETLPELRLHYRTIGKTTERRAGENDERRSHHARDNWQRRAVCAAAGIC